MEPFFGILVITLVISLFVATLGFVSVLFTTRKYLPTDASATKALALTLCSYIGSWFLLSMMMKLTDTNPGPFGRTEPVHIWFKIIGALIAWIVAMFGTWHLTKKMYAITNRQTTTIAWQLLCIISIYFGITMWKLISWMLQTTGYR